MTRHLFAIILMLVLFLSQTTIAQEVVFQKNWDAADSPSFDNLPEGRYGPQAFSISQDTVYLLDNQSHTIKTYLNKKLQDKIDVPAGIYLMQRTAHGFSVSDGKRVWLQTGGTFEEIHKTDGNAVVTGLQAKNGQIQIEVNAADKTFYGLDGIAKSQNETSAPTLNAIKENSESATIESFNQSFNIDFPNGDLASVQVVGSDAARRVYLNIELFESHVPLKIRREVRQYSSDGTLLNTLLLPAHGYAFIQQDLYVAPDGMLYHMLALENGLEIRRWDLNKKSESIRNYPRDQYGFHNLMPEERHMTEPVSPPPVEGILALPSVTPDEALETGDSYVRLTWTCNSNNITNGTITDQYGHKIRTPSWVVPGSHQNMAYKWGGFQTLNQFMQGLNSGKYAGDSYTSKNVGSPSAVGVDCSGFVSRCWNLNSHYSTRMMDDAITQAYDSWEETRPGDAAHIVGHVRLIVHHNPNGTITMVESAGYNWRVSYRAYSYSALSNYTPRYYVNMQGSPGNLPQPALQSVTQNNRVTLNWQLAQSDDINAIRLFESTNGSDWQMATEMDVESRSYSVATNDSCHFYKLVSLAKDAQTQSLPSDTYAQYATRNVRKVLIVDGFDRTTANSGSWPHPYHDFAAQLGSRLHQLGLPFETAANEAIISGSVALNDYWAVLWMVGDESTVNETFSGTEQEILKNYLRSGGNLFVSGSEIAWDLDYKGSSNDRQFFSSFLKAGYKEDDSGSYSVKGEAGSPFTDLSFSYDDGNHGVYKEDYPDVITAVNGSKVGLRYGNGKVAAVYYDGVFAGASTPAKLFYMGFPFETVYDLEKQQELLTQIINFFDTTTDLPGASPALATGFELLGNYPNPFNGQTVFRYNAHKSGEVVLTIFNTLGQKVFETIWAATTGPGRYTFNSAGLASGNYFYTLGYSNNNFRERGKFVLLK